jgi:uncharacterized protein involved in exopolysaccharide biosynthesis
MEDKNKTREIDLIGILKKMFSNKKALAIFIIVFVIAGVVVALNTPKQYTANVVLAPEISGMGMSKSIGDLASMVGVDLNTNSTSMDAIYPDIYPNIFASNDFVIKLFDVKVTLKDNITTKTYFNHLLQDTKVPFWRYPSIWILKILTKKVSGRNVKLDPFKLTEVESDVCDAIKGSIGCVIDKETNIITINVTDGDPQVAAIMADTIQKRLQQYISRYRTQKARNDLEYSKKIFIESKAQYTKAQEVYAGYADANTDPILESIKGKQEALENEMQLRYNIYNQAAMQLQTAKAKVQEHTPAFTIIQQATVPIKASSFPRSGVVIIFMILGVVANAIWIIFGQNLHKFWKR